MKEKALEALKEIQQSAQTIVDGYTLKTWRNIATNVIIRIYGQDSAPITQIKNINGGAYSSYESSAKHMQKQASELIGA